MTMGEKLLELRRGQGLSQEDVAELLRLMNDRKLSLAKSFLTWLNDAELD